eukprot:scaffold7453_cov128-Isochrysis_galbana.AAC.8
MGVPLPRPLSSSHTRAVLLPVQRLVRQPRGPTLAHWPCSCVPGAAPHRPCAPRARLVPFGFFISLSVKETSLPNQQAAMANEVYREGGHFSQKSGILSAFSFVREKRDDMMPSLAKKV